MLLFHAVSVATHVSTDAVTTHCHVGVTLQLYVVHAHAKLLTVPFAPVTSHTTKLLVLSLNVHVTTKYVQLKYVPTLLVNVTLGGVVSIHVIILDHEYVIFSAVSTAL